jgi:hypothetical protein
MNEVKQLIALACSITKKKAGQSINHRKPGLNIDKNYNMLNTIDLIDERISQKFATLKRIQPLPKSKPWKKKLKPTD